MSGDDPIQARFLSVLSHDLRGALHTVQLSLDMLGRDIDERVDPGQLSEDLQLGRSALIEATMRLERLVTAERLRRGTMPLRPHRFDAVSIVRQTVERVLAAALVGDAAAPKVVCDLPESWVIQSDPRLLGEMLAGLLDFAISRDAAIELSARPNTRSIKLRAATVWLDPAAEQMLQPAAEISEFDAPTVSLFVAGRCADLLGAEISVDTPAGPAQVLTVQFGGA